MNDYEAGEEELQSALECRKLLLQAGCDPSWVQDQSADYSSPLAAAFLHGIPEAMRLMFDHSGGLLNSEVIVDAFFNDTPLLSYCRGSANNIRHTIEGFSFLLRRGTNIRACDRWGNTCLHLCLDNIEFDSGISSSRATSVTAYLEQVRKSLTYLIQNDADIYAVDDAGYSVLDVAYKDSVRGHLWDITLADCGFDIAAFCTEEFCWHPHSFKYRWGNTLGEGFTKEVFVSLWKGQEHLCPYYEQAICHGFINEDEEEDDDDNDDDEDDEDYESDKESSDGGCML
ncbi:hypothetical protein OQA88_3243 [Cercophora sp. LCS_1]